MDKQEKRITVGLEELALTNTLALNALLELLEEKGVIKRQEVLDRVKVLRATVVKKPN